MRIFKFRLTSLLNAVFCFCLLLWIGANWPQGSKPIGQLLTKHNIVFGCQTKVYRSGFSTSPPKSLDSCNSNDIDYAEIQGYAGKAEAELLGKLNQLRCLEIGDRADVDNSVFVSAGKLPHLEYVFIYDLDLEPWDFVALLEAPALKEIWLDEDYFDGHIPRMISTLRPHIKFRVTGGVGYQFLPFELSN